MTQLPALPGIKKGQSFRAYVDYAIDGTPDDFPANQLRAQVRTVDGTLRAELSISATATTGRFLVECLDTSDWPIGNVFMDVKRTVLGETTVTQTVVIPVERPITA
jgi:hypothetical protein